MTITSRGYEPIVTDTIFLCLAGVFVGARLYTRGLIVHSIGKEDWLILFSLILSVGQTICVYRQVHFGLGKHVSELSETDGFLVNKALFFSIIFYTLGLSTTKLSILFQYLRLFVDKKVRKVTWIIITFVVAYAIFGIFSNIFLCVPVAKFWEPNLHGTCLKESTMWFLHASINIATDLVIWFLPMPTLYSLHMKRGQKLVLMFIFGLGGFVCIVSILRIWSIDVGVKTHDPTYDLTDAAILSSVEVNTAIICASIPMLKALANKIFPSIFGSYADPYSRSGPGYMLKDTKNGGETGTASRRATQVPGGTVTIIDALPDERPQTMSAYANSSDDGMNKDGAKGGIVMKTTIAQDIERGDMGSERRLIFQDYAK